MSKRTQGGGAGGFTLIELMVALLVIFALMGLILGGIRHIGKYSKRVADEATAKALQQGVIQFTQKFSFLPPLVKDGFDPAYPVGPLNPQNVPQVFTVADLAYLRTEKLGPVLTPPQAPQMDWRFSLCSIPYYVIGVLDQPRSGSDPTPVDGISGPGFRGVKKDGTFEKGGPTFGPFFDVSKNARAVFETQPGTGRIVLQDSRGTAFRYYRWRREDAVNTMVDLNVPWMVGDVNNLDPQTKNADYAIVSAGPDGLFGDEFLIIALAPTHPQALDRVPFDAKLGGRSPVGGPPGDPERAVRAMADNIVLVGTER